MDFLRINPHHAMMWQTCFLLRKSSISVMVVMGVMEDWRKGKLLDRMEIKKPSSGHISKTGFYQVFPKENEARMLANVLGNYCSNNRQK